MNAPNQTVLHDHASLRDDRQIPLRRVGIRNLRYPITVLDPHRGRQSTVADVLAAADLPPDTKGTHMSRFVEVLNEHRAEITIETIPAILRRLQERLEAHAAFLELVFPYFITKAAPVSGLESLMDYQCRFEASLRGDDFDFVLGVQVPVKSLCPCSKAISDRGAHNQRSYLDVRVRSSGLLWIEDLIACVETCGSSPLYALLKREDEKHVTELAYDNPRFVEDLVREVILAVRKIDTVRTIDVSVDNQESIHNHSAFAEASWSR
ncbi:MAG: GTP cyclohydrolase I FolE2 [Myxococcales bacterium]|nr:GTP cyclohydrolase I FolE2 [Myxococcales bacterium]MCB9717632.1 GTP cyclohydrolase I FolE2 [Myxococcales bacterium]